MRSIALVGLGFALSAGTALAQPMQTVPPMQHTRPMPPAAGEMPMHHGRPAAEAPMRRRGSSDGAGRRPMDRADANRAFNGGGVILEGPPGAPAPMPQAIAPGQRGETVVQVPAGGAQPPMGSRPPMR